MAVSTSGPPLHLFIPHYLHNLNTFTGCIPIKPEWEPERFLILFAEMQVISIWSYLIKSAHFNEIHFDFVLRWANRIRKLFNNVENQTLTIDIYLNPKLLDDKLYVHFQMLILLHVQNYIKLSVVITNLVKALKKT